MPEARQPVAVLTDSDCDLPQECFKKYPLYRLPLGIACGERSYRDGVDITVEDVYARQPNENFKTSLPSEADIDAALDAIRDAGYKQVLVMPIATVLSEGTANLLRIEAEERTDLEIALFDTKSSSVGVGAIALQAAQYAARGVPFHVLKRVMPQVIEDTEVFFCLDTLEYLRRGGRIGRATAIVGTMLQIKPILSFDRTGTIYTPAKVRGRKAVAPWLVQHLVEMVEKAKAERGAVRFNLMVCDGGVPEEADALQAELECALPGSEQIIRGQLDATLAVHLGPHLLGAGIQFLRANLPG